MRFQQLRDFLAVVAHGGYRVAARALKVSQAGLTKSVAKLEKEHGIELLQRTTQGVELTVRGREFLLYARAVLHEVDRAQSWLQHSGSLALTQVSIGVSLEPSLMLVPAVLRDFRSACPKAAIHLTQRSSNELVAAVLENQLDFAVSKLTQDTYSEDFSCQSLYSTRAAIMVRRGHPLCSATSIGQLAASQWIVVGDPTQPGQHDESIQELFLKQRLPQPAFAAVSDSLFGAISMLLESDCVARLPALLLQHPLTSNNLVEIHVHEQSNLAYEVGIISKPGRRMSAEAAQLMAMLKSFARLPGALARQTREPNSLIRA